MGLEQLVAISGEGVTLDRPSPKKVAVQFVDTGAAGKIMLVVRETEREFYMIRFREFLEPDQ